MIASLLLSLAGIAANEKSLWNLVTGAVEQAFGDHSLLNEIASGNLWDQLDIGVATASMHTGLIEGLLSEIDFDAYVEGMFTQLQGMLELAGDTTGMNTTQIVEAAKAAGFEPQSYGWEEDVDMEDLLDQLQTLVLSLEVLSYTEDLNLTGYSSLDDMQSLLTEFGYDDLYDLGGINDYLENTVENAIPLQYTEYLSQLNEIEEELEDIINGESDALSLDEVLSNVEALRDALESEGASDLDEAIDGLYTVIEVLKFFDLEPIGILTVLSENMETIFDETNYSLDDLDTSVGDEWLSDFVSAMEVLSGNNMYEVCESNYAQNIIKNEYETVATYVSMCPLMVTFSAAPSCHCLQGTGLYDNPDKEDVLNSLNCLFNAEEDLTVEQSLHECYGENIQIDQMRDVFETLGGLAGGLAGDNLENFDDMSNLSEQYEDIWNDLDDLADSDIVSDGSDDEYKDSMTSWIDSFEELLADLDADGTYAAERQEITDMLDSAVSNLQSEKDSKDDESEESAGASGANSLQWWAVLLIIVSVAAICFLIVSSIVWRRNRKQRLARCAMEIEGEGEYPRDGGFPVSYDGHVSTGDTAGNAVSFDGPVRTGDTVG
jgi:hypothetical protein